VEAVSAAQLKNRLGSVLRQALTQGVLAITRHNDTYVIILSVEEYRTLLRFAPPPIKALEREFDALVKSMQTKKSKRAVRALFKTTPAQLGRSAAKAARRKTRS
jgi:prevent-host-death family protein